MPRDPQKKFFILHAQKFGHAGGAARRGRKDFTPLPVANFEWSPKAAVLAGGFGIMTRFAECLPVAPVPEQLLVSPMRNDMIDDLCGSDSTFAFARRAQRVLA